MALSFDPDMNDEVRVTVIATGFDERKQKVELPGISKWAPKEEVKEIRPVINRELREPVSLKATERVLAKSLNYSIEPAMPRDIFAYEEEMDLPAFLRRPGQQIQQKGI